MLLEFDSIVLCAWLHSPQYEIQFIIYYVTSAPLHCNAFFLQTSKLKHGYPLYIAYLLERGLSEITGLSFTKKSLLHVDPF